MKFGQILLSFVAAMAVFLMAAKTAEGAVKTAKKTPIKKVVVVKKPVVKKPAVKGATTIKKPVVVLTKFSIVACKMPDGKTLKTTKDLCDRVTAFWAKHTPSVNHGGGSTNNNNNNNNSSNNNGNNNSGGGSSEPTLTPTPTIAPTPTPLASPMFGSLEVYRCTAGSSCHGYVFGVKMVGSGFPNDARMRLVRNGQYYYGQLQERSTTVVWEDFRGLSTLCDASSGYVVEVYSESVPSVKTDSGTWKIEGYCSNWGSGTYW